MSDVDRAFQFLAALEVRLKSHLPLQPEMAAKVAAVWNKPEGEKSPRENLACKENIFLYHFALPEIFDQLRQFSDLSEVDARRSIRCEYFNKFPEYSSRNAFRRAGHPFPKSVLGMSAKKVMSQWRSAPTKFPMHQAYPDMALSDPFPYRIVFDAKLFESESPAAAEAALVNGIYETAFYRGLPPSADHDDDSDWNYDYACLLAYDASAGGHLRAAWDSVTCKPLFWNDAGVYVMVI